jgi:pimeloyl-ACP methyl ester carboxylesterase
MRTGRGWFGWVGVTASLLSGLGCGLFYRAPAPLPSTAYSAQSSDQARREVLVLLPGRGDHASAYAEQGIIALAQQTDPQLELVAADATLGYYIHRNLIPRLMDDVIAPARSRGYRTVALGGISMGGLGALLFAQHHAEVLSAVIVVAPFLGDDDLLDEIERAGGVGSWSPPPKIDPEDYQRSLWAWLKSCVEKRAVCPPIFLGFGTDDRFLRGERLLAAVLPAHQVATVPGGHEWEPWRKLFALLLPRMLAASGDHARLLPGDQAP